MGIRIDGGNGRCDFIFLDCRNCLCDLYDRESGKMKKSETTALGVCFPRAVVILLYIFIFFDIADADGGGAGMGTDGDADGPNFIHHIEAFCQEGLTHFFCGGMAFLFPTHQQYAIEFLFAAISFLVISMMV